MLERRRPRPDRSRADLEQLLTREGINLREGIIWQLLYERAARSVEVLAFDVENLGLPNRRAQDGADHREHDRG